MFYWLQLCHLLRRYICLVLMVYCIAWKCHVITLCYDLCCECDCFVVFSNIKATIPSVFWIDYSWKHSFALVFCYTGWLSRYVFVIFWFLCATSYRFVYVFATLTQICSLMFLQTLDYCTGTNSCFKHFLNLYRNNCLSISFQLIAKCLLKVSAMVSATCCIIPQICQFIIRNECFY